MVETSRQAHIELPELAREAMAARGLEPDFPPEALREVAGIGGPANPSTDPDTQIRDLRALAWASIDNDDSRDLDQLTVAEQLTDSSTRIMVAVADVDALVKKDSPVDLHAHWNTTSVYTAGGIFPMLPERLSTDLTSLGEHEDRLAVVISFVVESDGSIGASEIFRAWVRNRAKLAYNGVAAWLDGTGVMPAAMASAPAVPEQIRLQDKIAQQLKTLRHEHGALDLETIETHAVIENGRVVGLVREEKNRAKQLIEDFMIAANGITAGYLQAKGLPSLRRVVRTPERWDRIVDLAATLGVRLPAEPDAQALESFLIERRRIDPLRFPDLSLIIVKLMGRGEYVVQQPGESSAGHFGLAVRDYSHSTAPNRRYPDLITQRLLKAALGNERPPYSLDEMQALAEHCTIQEDAANKVERQVRKSAAALLLSSRIGQEFDALVTGASEKGVWVRALDPPVEGKLVRGARGLDVGDRVSVRLTATDVQRGFIDFVRVGS